MTQLPPEQVLERIRAALPGVAVELIQNPSPSGQHSVMVERKDAVEVARFLRDDPELLLDFASNVSGVDWLGKPGQPGFFEVVYHLYSIAKRHGPIVLRLRTADREHNVTVPSLTPIYRSAEFQEREVFDLFGVHFEGHPDLRRLLMWDEFEDHPMRKDYVAP